MIPFKCCLCLEPCQEFPQDFKSVLNDFMRLFGKFPSCGLSCIKLNELTMCKSCWIYFMRVHHLKHQLRFKKEIFDTDKSFLRSKIRRAQRLLTKTGNNLSSCGDYEVQISASTDHDDSDSDAGGQAVEDKGEAISCSLNNTDESDNESLGSCQTAELTHTDNNAPVSASSQVKYPQNETDKPQEDIDERNPLLLDLLMAPVENHRRYSPPVRCSVSRDSDVESSELYEITDVITPTTRSLPITAYSAAEVPAKATSADTSEFHSESGPSKSVMQLSNSVTSPEEQPAKATSDDKSASDSELTTIHRVTLRSKRLPKKVKRSYVLKIRSSDVKQMSKTKFTYLKKYPFRRTDVGFKCGLCPAISKVNKGSSGIWKNMLRHIYEWHVGNHGVRATRIRRLFIEIAPNRFQYGKYKVELIDGSYRCEECGEVRTGPNKATNIREHIQSKHENPTRSYVCEFCGKVYRTLFGLSEHKKVKHATNTQRFPCSECDKTYASRAKALTHHKIFHQGLYKEKYICEICGKECSTKYRLQDHIAFIHRGQKIKCDLCDKSFGSRIALSIHRHCHLGTKFICDICGMDFSQQCSVTRHKRTAHPQ